MSSDTRIMRVLEVVHLSPCWASLEANGWTTVEVGSDNVATMVKGG